MNLHEEYGKAVFALKVAQAKVAQLEQALASEYNQQVEQSEPSESPDPVG